MSPTLPLTGPCSSGAWPCPGNGPHPWRQRRRRGGRRETARARGLTVIGTAGTDEGRRLAQEQGAHDVLDHYRKGYLQEAKHLTQDRGVDLICELLANVNLDRDLEILATRGRVVVIGSRGTVTIDPRRTMMQESDIRGMTDRAPPTRSLGRSSHDQDKMANGTLKPVVGRELPLAAAAQAHRDIMEKKAYGKIILVP